jgi:hypothetical protein
MDAFEQDRAYTRYRLDPNVRRRQALEYLRETAQALLIFAASLTVARLFDTPSPERAGILLGIVACAGNLATSYLVHGWIVKDIARAMVREDREVFRRAREASAEAQADQVIAAARANAIVGSVRSASPKRLG